MNDQGEEFSAPGEPADAGGSLQGFQRRFLRGKAHELRPVVQVGEAGVTDGVVAAVDPALADHELVKIRLMRPPDKKAAAAELARRTGAEMCGVVGHTVILYRPDPDEPTIQLPSRSP